MEIQMQQETEEKFLPVFGARATEFFSRFDSKLQSDELENLKAQARLNPALAQALLDTRTVSNPVTAFCRIAQENGCTFSAMDLISAGEDSYAAMRRSTNGGGENSPLLQGEDDLYEMFLVELL